LLGISLGNLNNRDVKEKKEKSISFQLKFDF
jgi:hypothetical protein